MLPHAIWLIEPSKLLRDCLRNLLDVSVFNVCLEASSWSDVFSRLDLVPTPELILMSVVNALEEDIIAIEQASSLAPAIVLADTMTLGRLRDAMRAGASGFLTKSISAAGLQQSLKLILTGEKVLPTELADELVDNAIPVAPSTVTLRLSQQENAILIAVAAGSSNKDIANTLNVAEGTVKVHMKSVFRKIGVNNRTEAAIWAMRHRT